MAIAGQRDRVFMVETAHAVDRPGIASVDVVRNDVPDLTRVVIAHGGGPLHARPIDPVGAFLVGE